MSTKLSEEEKRVGAYNFNQAAADIAAKNPNRRTFLKAVTAAGAVLPVSAAVYFGYDSWKGNKAVKAAIIGVGDEGGVLIGEHNPEYLQFVAVCDLRPSNIKRVIEGEPAPSPRKGFNKIYGPDTAAKVEKYDDYKKLIADAKKLGIEAVVIATPLFTHKDIAVECMNAGLHVLCEKLMARDVKSCKEMIASAKKNGVLLSVGHQRHYSLLYAHALEVVNSGILGDIKHIRAQWPRNNSWPYVPTEAALKTFATGKDIDGKTFDLPELIDGWVQAGPQGRRRTVPEGPRSPQEDRLPVDHRTRPLAAVRPHRRWPDGRTRQPPTRRHQHLPRQSPPAVRQRRRRQVLLRPRQERPRVERRRVHHVRIPRPQSPEGGQPRQGRE